MLFNSFDFAIFMPVVFLIYWTISKNVKIQNFFLLAASYFFYAWWDWRYLSLILACATTNFAAGLLLMKNENPGIRKAILTVCCLISLGILGFFKYYNFFVISFCDAFQLFGADIQPHTLKLILPVGISFYTFHTLSYTIDVYRRNFTPTKDIVSFFLFVSIFPLAMSGPIERAPNLLPQIYRKRSFDYGQLTEGLRLVLWGLFMKVTIADRLGVYVDAVYDNAAHHNGVSLLFATVFFSFQIYCDFAGYSCMAIGIGKTLGFNFLNNFNRPILAVSVTDNWRRWHITLSKWFKDYLYIPLGGNRCSKNRNYLNLMTVFIISGIWHGANWTFIIWGGLNGVFQVIEKMFKKQRDKLDNFMKRTKPGAVLLYIFSVSATFLLISLTRVFFRADNLNVAFRILKNMATERGSLFTNNIDSIVYGLFFIFVLVVSDLLQERNKGAHFFLENKNPIVRYASYIILILTIVLFGVFDSSQFIYFQF